MANTALKRVPCKICANNAKLYCVKESVSYYICKECHSIFQYPLPESRHMAEYTDNQYKFGNYERYVAAKYIKHCHFRNRLNQFRQYFPSGKLLDVGCSCGYFLDVALEYGYDAYGVELSETAIAAADPAIRLRIAKESVNVLGSHKLGSFDLVTAFDIIEHTDNPVEFLRQVKALLKPRGGLVLSTPDTGHFLRYMLGKRWAMLQPMQHTVLFSRKSLRTALEHTGFKEIHIITAYKTVTIDYLMQQINEYNPVFFRVYRMLNSLIPIVARESLLTVNIGEMLAIVVN